MSGGDYKYNRFDAFEKSLKEGSCTKGYQEGGEVKKCDKDECKHCEGKGCEKCEDKKEKEEVKEGAKPDYLDLDKDGNKEESMKKAASEKSKKSLKKEESGAELQARLIAGHKQKRAPKKGTKAHDKYWDKEEAAMKKEELEATGLFTAEEIEGLLGKS